MANKFSANEDSVNKAVTKESLVSTFKEIRLRSEKTFLPSAT